MSNEYDAAVTASLQPDAAQSARVGFSAATDTNPDAYAEAKRVARRTGVPVDTVFALPNEIKRQDAIGSIDFDTLAQTSPSTAALLADVEKAKVAHDDVPGMGEIERKLRQFGGGAVEAVGMAASGTGRLLDVAQRSAAGWAGLMLPEPMAGGAPTLDSLAGPMIGEGWQDTGKIVKNTSRNNLMVPAAQQTFGDQVAGGLGQVAAQILMLPFTRGAGLYAQGADAMGEKIDGDNAPQWKKDLATVGGAGITGITEKWALDKLLGPMVVPVKNQIAASLSRIGIAAAAEGGQEFSENVLHDSLRKMMTNSEAKIDFGQSIGEGGVGAAVGGIVRTVVEAGLHIKSRGQQAQQATEAGDLLVKLNTMAEASKLVQRDSETAQGFFQSILDEGRDAVYISPEALAQSGLAEQMAQSIPAVAEQLGTAAEAGHDIRIPIADLMATMAGPELEQSLLPHVAIEPGGFTTTTAQEYLQSDQSKELQAEVERVLGEKEGDDTFKASAQAVKTTVKDQLTTAGRFTESVNDAYSAMVGNFYAVQAARMGTTPEAMFEKYPLRIGAESIAGQQFAQITPEQAMATNVVTEMPADPTFSEAVGNTPGAQITDNGLLIDLVRYQKPEQEGAQAIRTGVFYLPTGASTAKHYKKKGTLASGNEYGGAEEFKGQTIIRRPLFVKGATGGKAPEVAYDMLKGKGAYQKMRTDVLHATTGWGVNESQKEENVSEILSRYGADPDLAYEIVRVSKKGNLLPYAVQENIVAHAVREAGYDAVVGYSKGKAGANISEVFDVREQTFPARGMESDVHESYLQDKAGARGSFNPATLQITLLKNADLSTFLHESAHFFLEVQADLAGQLMQDASIHGADTLKPGEQQVVKDMQATLDWFGIKNLSEWNALDFEEKRSYHEQFARGFESYLFEGKAPSIEMQGLFQRFRAWMMNVYRDLKALNVELTDEVRGVFDRMLATNEQITLAEQGRSMMPLFTSPEQIGMTPAEFADYQALGTDATNEAIEGLQARGLRDMQWIHNARGRVIKQLQKESAAKRAEVKMGVRSEVMSQPIYRAWQFLTAKMTADDQIEPVAPPKSDPNVLDETIDSMFVAIAKLGGINKDDVVKTWGVDPADKPSSGLFGKPLWRVEGGLSIDGMAEALSQYGYLEKDEHGKWDIRELEDKFKAELGGDAQFSTAYDYAGNQPIRPGDQVANPMGLAAGRLDRASLTEIGLPVEIINHMDALRMVRKDGIHPDIVAEMFGFSSGDELVRRLAAAEAPKAEIEALTDQRMLEQFGDLSSEEAIKKAADKAIHNDVRARLVATELAALEKATGKRTTLASAAKEYASAMIARLKVRDIKPGQYAAGEVRAAKAAEKASKGGDIATAAAEKRNQLINTYATRAAYDAQEEVDALRRKWSALANRTDDKLKKSYDMDLVNAVRAILGEYGIAEKKAKRAIDYLETVKKQDPEMYGIVSASIDSAAANAKPFKDMTVEEVRGLGEEIDSILHLAKRVRQMEVDGDMIDRQEIEDALRVRMEEIGVQDEMPGDTSAITEGETRMLRFRTAMAALTRVESWVGRMDGMASFGPFRRFVYSRIKDAADSYRTDKAKYLKQFRDLFDAIAPTMKQSRIAAPELGYTFGKDNGGAAINEIVHAILHTGNDSNMRKLLLGRNWAQERPDGSLDTSRWDAFIQRMANEGKITKAHFDFAQGVWDLLESTKPLAQKTHRDVFGKYFDEVTARPLATPFGTYAGGYVPAQADSRIVADANMRALAESENQSMQFAFPTTSKGFTKGRVDYNKPLLLDLRTLAQHIDKVLLFSHMEMPVRDVQRVLSSVGGTLNRIDPEAIPAMLTPWLNRAAKQQVTTPMTADAGLSRFLSVARSRAGAAAMFGNLANAVQQITGFSLAAIKVRPSLMLSATADFAKGPRDFVAAVSESSPYMAERLSSEVAAMSDDINQILLNPSLLEQGQAWTMKHAYFLQTAIDSCMSPIIWTAAYNQAVEQGMNHKDAVRLGDSAVRETQGSTSPEDISRIEAGPAWARLFTQFAGYFNMQANLLGTEFAKVMQEYGLKKGAGKGIYILAFGFLAPAIVGELIMQVFRGGPGDDDKDGEYLDDWLAALFFWAPIRNAAAMLPGVGQVIVSSFNAWNSKPYDDRIASSPAVSMVESAIKSPVSVYQAIANDGSPQKAVRDVSTLISMSVGLPANLAARPIGYLSGMADGRIAPTSEVDMARGLVTGMASPESKR